MRFDICRSDFEILTTVLVLLREKGGRNPSITRKEIWLASGLENTTLSQKIKNSYLKEKILKERIQ